MNSSYLGSILLILIVLSTFYPISFFLGDGSYVTLAQSLSSHPEKQLLPSSVLLTQVEEYMPDISIVIGVVSPNGTEVYSYGNISKVNNTKVNENSIFDIGSITKTFTTALLMDMVKGGLINLDDPIEKYLPENVIVPSYDGHLITIENLATHTSGLPDFPTNWNRNQIYTNEQVYSFLSNMSLQSEPGVFANYSDFGMGLLGHILALKSGASYESLVKDRILNVLGMDSTGIAMNSTSVTYPDLIKSRLAMGHSGGEEIGLEFIPEALQSAGAMYSTANDLMKYLSANLGLIDTKINDIMQETQLIRSEYQQPPATRATAELFSSNNSLSASFVGLGWFIDTNLGEEIIQHSGSIDGYSSFIGFNPDKQVGLIELCSCEGVDMPMEVRESLADFIVATLA
ncbi:MAG TPA: serine hydrolase domain-containing protein [Candidatus Nitrosocosmicus sp.]|nr:serine hydrolase domain-containing protein [Candidatus Nitrosocosmicus sp.]